MIKAVVSDVRHRSLHSRDKNALDVLLAGRWTLDPIDGTKGFLRGGQYAVCLALIVDGKVVLGVIGCPNLPVESDYPDGPKGCIFVAVKGQGAEQVWQGTLGLFSFLLMDTCRRRSRAITRCS